MATDAPTSAPRQIGNYELLSKIAEGGMGAVYKGRNLTTGDIVAIKIVPSETAKNPVLLKRFEQEFNAAKMIDHPNVVKAIEYSGASPNPFLVMEFVDGESLGAKVEREGAIPEAEAIHIITQVCEGLHRAHKQSLIHRDVKPDNVLVTRDGVAKLTDMGLVKDVESESNLTRTGRGLGTPHFMSPEQFRNAKNANVQCDIYSLGATLYMMLTGDVPFAKTSPLDCWMKKVKNDFPPPKTLNPLLSDRINWAVLRAMSAEPTQRPASCREFMEDLTGAAWKTQKMAIPEEAATAPVATGDLWYLVYKDPAGTPHTVKGTTDSIRQNVQSGALGDPSGVLVCRTKTGQFVALRTHPEFRDMVVGPGVSTAMPSGKVPVAQPAPLARPTSVRTPAAPVGGTQYHPPGTDMGTGPPMYPHGGGVGFEKWLPWVLAAAAGVAAASGAYFLFAR